MTATPTRPGGHHATLVPSRRRPRDRGGARPRRLPDTHPAAEPSAANRRPARAARPHGPAHQRARRRPDPRARRRRPRQRAPRRPQPRRPGADGDPVAAQVAVAYAVAAWTVQPGDGPRAWITAVAAYTTPAYQARLEDSAATGGTTTPPAATAVRITGVTPLAPDAGGWRFQVTLVATTATTRGPRRVGVSMLIDLDATPLGPRVADAQ